jgi:hypothetical protein
VVDRGLIIVFPYRSYVADNCGNPICKTTAAFGPGPTTRLCSPSQLAQSRAERLAAL